MIGDRAGYANTTGHYNTFLGSLSGYTNTTGNYNTFSGMYSGFSNTTGTSNVFNGYYSGRSNTTGHRNTFLGFQSGYKNTSSPGSVFIGYQAGYNEKTGNKLYIDNSSTTTPLIYGKFDTDQVGINTKNIPSGFALAVKGKVITDEVKVAVEGTAGWPDFVFEKNYPLPSLKSVEQHINLYGHLQNIPSSKEVAKNGIFLGDMNAKLLQKIEELTLYTIQQQKELEAQQQKNKTLEARLEALESHLKN